MTDWTKKSIVPRGGLEAWLQYEPDVSGHNIIYDYSGNNRTVTCGAGNAPVLTSNVLNGQPGWYFSGTRDPLTFSGNFSTYYAFLIGSFQDPTFTEYQGFLTGLSIGDLMISNNSADLMFDQGVATYDYRKNDVAYADNARKAPVSASHSVMELLMPPGMTMNGISIGQDRSFTARKLKGWFFDALLYSALPTDLMRFKCLQYAAMRYQIWPRILDGTAVFPFAANKSYTREHGRETYLSEPYEGDPKALVRGNFKSGYDLSFQLREQEEFDAAKAFYQAHHPLTPFILRDYRFYPYRDTKVRFTTPIREQGSDVTYRFNYSFGVVEVDS